MTIATGSDTPVPDFDIPALSFDAVADREEGKLPFGVREVTLNGMFEAFATATVELFVRLALTLGFR